MNYELAKQLKDAGLNSSVMRRKAMQIDDWYSPTLSELIEACGNDFYMLWKSCPYPNPIFTAKHDGGTGMDITARGSTPEEAVAKLWLELNK